VLTPLTWARNADWASDLALLEKDYPRIRFKRPILSSLITANIRDGNYVRAADICKIESSWLDTYSSALIHCGGAYAYLGRYTEAENAYVKATSGNRSEPWAHVNLAMMYAHLGRRSEALERFQAAIADEKQPFFREYFTALMLLQVYPSDRARLLEARAHLERALQLQPQHADSREELDSLNQRLARLQKP
jgi:tetratricopeptide (TPR) repeat protein